MKSYRFVEEVYEDLETTIEWLDDKQIGLGHEFESEFFAAVNVARTNSTSYAIDQTGYRPIPLKRFSAVMYFSIEQDIIVVAGVFMGGRSETNLRDRG